MKVLIAALGACIGSIASVAVQASGASPYMPLNLSPEIERKVERVLILGDRPVLTRPIPIAKVLEALPKACQRDAVLCRQVRHYLDRYFHDAALTHASLEAAVAKKSSVILPNERGMPDDANWDVSASGYYRPTDHVLLSAGGFAYSGRFDPTGTMASVGDEYLQVDVGYRDQWFSPLTDSSMLPSTEAPSMPGITVSNYEPITRLGLQYELFISQMSESDRILYQGSYTSGHPWLAGAHFAIEPAPGWSMSFNRVLQYGGGGYGHPINLVLDAFNPFNKANTTGSAVSNSEASITSAFVFPGTTPFTAYVEFAGEDNFHGFILRMGKTALAAGIHIPELWHRFDFVYEIDEWQNLWWVHSVFQDGMTNYGVVLGAWGGQWRAFGDGVPAVAQSVGLSWPLHQDDELALRYRNLQNQSVASSLGIDYRRAQELSLSYSRPWRTLTVGTELEGGRDVFGSPFGRLSVFARYGGADDESDDSYVDDADDDDADAADDDEPKSAGAERFVDMGFGAEQWGFDLTDGIHPRYVSYQSGAHLGLGVRRMITARSSLGIRAEYDSIGGVPLLGVRALDYRYLIGKHLAWGAFFGMARYAAVTSAQGYYLGTGVQWVNLLPHWDLSLDARYLDRIQRTKLLPGEDNGGGYDSEFYTALGLTLYLSRRF